jgi:hypothetical protein
MPKNAMLFTSSTPINHEVPGAIIGYDALALGMLRWWLALIDHEIEMQWKYYIG